MFENETGAVSRKAGGVTSCSRVHRTSRRPARPRTPVVRCSGAIRPLSPRATARTTPSCCSGSPRRSNGRGFLAHHRRVWDTRTRSRTTPRSTSSCIGTPYGGFLTAATGFSAVSGTAEMATSREFVDDPDSRTPQAPSPVPSGSPRRSTARCAPPSAAGGTIWIYTGALQHARCDWRPTSTPATYGDWAVSNRAKSRDRQDPTGDTRVPRLGLLVARQPPRALQQRRGPRRRRRLLHGSGLVRTTLRVRLMRRVVVHRRCSTTRAGTARSTVWPTSRRPVLAATSQQPALRRRCAADHVPCGSLPGPRGAVRDAAPGSSGATSGVATPRSHELGPRADRHARRGSLASRRRRRPSPTRRCRPTRWC